MPDSSSFTRERPRWETPPRRWQLLRPTISQLNRMQVGYKEPLGLVVELEN